MIGIYMILNNNNGNAYIGQSKNIEKRKQQHINSLINNNHHNQYLQRAWNKYKGKNFDFFVLEKCDKEFLNNAKMFCIQI